MLCGDSMKRMIGLIVLLEVPDSLSDEQVREHIQSTLEMEMCEAYENDTTQAYMPIQVVGVTLVAPARKSE
jgi:hypothetical protein